MTRVLLHPLAGVLSAYGMGLADVRALKQQAQEAILSGETLAAAEATLEALEAAARADVAAQGIPTDGSRRSARCTSSTKAPTRRSRPASTRPPNVVVEFERKYRQQYGFLMPGKPLVVEAVAVEAIGRTHDARDAVPVFAPRAPAARADPDEPDLHRRRVPRRRRLRPAAPSPRRRHRGARGDPRGQRDDRRRARLARDVHGAGRPRARADRSGAARARDRHDRRPDPARGLQQPLHGDRRADGRDARQHRLFGQHQGAARFLLRALRRRRQSGRERAAHAGASGLDGREREDDHRAARRHDEAGRRLRAERSVQRRHASPGRDGDRAGVPRCGPRPRARILRRLAGPPRGHRRHHAGVDAARFDARRRGGRAARQRATGRRGPVPRGRDARHPRRRAGTRRATSTRISPTSARRSPRARKARRSSRRWSRTSGCRSCAPTCGTCRTTRRNRCAACSTC